MTLVKVNNPLTRNLDGFVNDWFNDFPAAFGKAFREDVLAFPPVNVVEKETEYQLEIAAPGFDKADFSIKLDGNLLNVAAEKKAETTNENGKVIRKEFSHRSFKRNFTVDEKIENSNIKAVYENGILKVTLPKKEVAKATTKEITIQ